MDNAPQTDEAIGTEDSVPGVSDSIVSGDVSPGSYRDFLQLYVPAQYVHIKEGDWSAEVRQYKFEEM